MRSSEFGWWGVFRLGLVQAALGAIVVLTTSTLNRVMVVELALPAAVPGLLVGLHHALQLMRPRLGHQSDVGHRRTPWILGGMAILALGGTGAAAGTALAATWPAAGLAVAAAAFVLIGLGTGSAGTALLVLLAGGVREHRQAAAATVVWVMMIMGFAVTAGTAGHFLDPYSPARLVQVAAVVCVAALALTAAALLGLEAQATRPMAPASGATGTGRDAFREALSEAWSGAATRRFTVFVFVSMLAYSLQDLILEPFAGVAFGLTPGQTTRISGLQHGGALAGMALAGAACSFRRLGSLGLWTTAGCVASALALAGLAVASRSPEGWPLHANVFALGFANGVFAVGAISSMMRLAAADGGRRQGLRMGLWGAAQAIACGIGGVAGALAADLARWVVGDPVRAYSIVFGAESALFLLSIRWVAPEAGRGAHPAPEGRATESGNLAPASATQG